MHRKSFAAALLLPLPFAALPLAVLLFSHVHSPAGISIPQGDAAAIRIDASPPTTPLTVSVTDSSHTGCRDASIPPIEG